MWNIRQALTEANARREDPITIIEIAKMLWPDSSIESQRINGNKLMKEDKKTVNVNHIPKICKLLQCDANKLFNL